MKYTKNHIEQSHADGDLNEELILFFLTDFRLLERALVRAGFTRSGGASKNARADWVRFARHIEGRFRPESSPELEGAVSYLLYDPQRLELHRERLQDSWPGDACDASSDILWLSELVEEAGKKLSHEINFEKRTEYDPAYLTAAWLVVEAWSHCDPTVEGLLKDVQ